jgi:hypothetical protein
MMSFLILRSLTRGMELVKDPGGSNTMPLLGEDAIMMVYGGRPHQGGVACLPKAPGARLIVVWGTGTQGCKGTRERRTKR